MPYNALQLAEAFIRAGELADALDALQTHLDANPADDASRRLRVSILRRMPDESHYRAALDDLDHLSSLTADDWVQRSILLQGLNDWSGANTAMEQARHLAPDDERITERYLLTLEKSGQNGDALALLESLPQTWRWLQTAGDIAQRMGDTEAALKHYTAALAHLEARLDTANNAFAANLKEVLLLKRESLTRGA